MNYNEYEFEQPVVKIIKPSHVYSDNWEKALDEVLKKYNIVSFEPPVFGATYFSNHNYPMTYDDKSGPPNGGPRFILQKKEVSVSLQFLMVFASSIYNAPSITIPQGYEYSGFRVPKQGEFYIDPYNGRVVSGVGSEKDPRIVVTLVL